MSQGPEIGDVIESRYRLDGVLGRGGHAIVFEAESLRTGQKVAIKFIRPASADQDQSQRLFKRFEREIELVARLQHPHVVRLLDRGSLGGGSQYAVFEHLAGRDLRAVLVEDGACPLDEAARLMYQVAAGADAAHKLGIIHRDLKPANIMICQQGTRSHAVVLDFGIASLMRWARPADYQAITTSDSLVGSLPYTSPERIAGREVTAQSDIYSWGLIFLEAITGSAVITGRTPLDIANAHMDASPIQLPRDVVSIKPLAAVLRRATAKKSADRFESMVQVMEALEPVLASAPSKRLTVAKPSAVKGASGVRAPWWRRLGSPK